MPRTSKYLTASFFLYLTFINPVVSRADPYFDSSSDDQSEKTVAVNQQLDIYESSRFKEGDAAQTFSVQQPQAEKEFLKTNLNTPQTPLKSSAGSTLKDFFNPDLSGKPQDKNMSSVKTRAHSLDMGSEIFYYQYREPDVGVKIHGPMYGYFADYAYRPADPNFFNNFLTNVYMLQARYASSHDLEYKGSGIAKDKHDEAMEFRGLIGKDYFVGTNSRVTPYFGFGYRYLLDHGNGEISSIGDYGYDRKSHYYYLPLGGNVVINLPRHWEVGFNAEYDIFIQGMQKSFLSDGDQFTGFNNPDVTSHQDHGFGIRGSIKFLKHGYGVDFYVEPYIRFWNIDASKEELVTADGSTGLGEEPKNSTTEIGSKFGIQF